MLLSTDSHVLVNASAAKIGNGSSQKLLGKITDAEVSFEKHIEQIYTKARAKLKALARIAPFMNIQKKKVLMEAFFTARFSYCPLIWMLHSRKLNNKIKLHEHCLRGVYIHNTSSFKEPVETDNSVSVHRRNIRVLAIELHKK